MHSPARFIDHLPSDRKPSKCPACRVEAVQPAIYYRKFNVKGEVISVPLETGRCTNCDTEVSNNQQHNRNLAALQSRRRLYGETPLGSDYLGLRMRYGLSLYGLGRILGKSGRTIRAYEAERSHPDSTTSKLVNLVIDHPHMLKYLADKADVEVPLWHQRMLDYSQRIDGNYLKELEGM